MAAKAVGIATTIGDQTSSRTCRLDQFIRNADVADVAKREPTTQNIGQDMNFCGLTSAR
jgi:hypothetical protein